jgi:two-component system, cell cycle sensor histidine kinase and response regulator CckA
VEILRGSGFKTEAFSSMGDAVQWLRGHSPETLVVVSDIVMPDMDVAGFIKTCRALRTDLKIVWMSGYISAHIQEWVRDSIFLQKPFPPAALLEAIKH